MSGGSKGETSVVLKVNILCGLSLFLLHFKLLEGLDGCLDVDAPISGCLDWFRFGSIASWSALAVVFLWRAREIRSLPFLSRPCSCLFFRVSWLFLSSYFYWFFSFCGFLLASGVVGYQTVIPPFAMPPPGPNAVALLLLPLPPPPPLLLLLALLLSGLLFVLLLPLASTGLALRGRMVFCVFSHCTCGSLFKCSRFALCTLEMVAPQPQATILAQ